MRRGDPGRRAAHRPRSGPGTGHRGDPAHRGDGRAAVKALCWQGINKLSVERVDDPAILNRSDAIVRVLASSVCGSDLHLVDGYMPTMREGDILGHEFVGEIDEVGPGVHDRRDSELTVVRPVNGYGSAWK